jgi:phosphoserine phosphatase RsbU/P
MAGLFLAPTCRGGTSPAPGPAYADTNLKSTSPGIESSSRAPGGTLVFLWAGLGSVIFSLAKVRSRKLPPDQPDPILGAICQSLAEGIVVCDRAGRFVLVNRAAEEMLGKLDAGVDPREWSQVFGCYLPDGQTLYPPGQLPLMRAMRGEPVQEAEVFIRNAKFPQGKVISVNGVPLLDDAETLVGGIVTFRDITERKQVDRELRESLRQLKEMKYALDQAAIVCTTDAEGTILYANDKFCEISGYGREGLAGKTHRIINSGYHPKAFFRKMWETIAGGRTWRGEISNRAKDGRIFWVDTTIVPFVDESGKPARYMSIQTDITDSRKEHEVVGRLSSAVEQTADVIFITNREGTIEYVNPAFERTTGFSREEALGKNPRILKSGVHDPDYYKSLWETILAGEVFRHTSINRKKNGELFHAEQTITPMKDLDGRVTHFVSVVKDLTEQVKRREREIEMQYASEVQKKLYPAQPPRVESLGISGVVFPAVATCGDYYDYLSMPDGALGLAIGDVCGHGLGPALIMVGARAYLRLLARASFDLRQIFTTMNRELWADLQNGNFVTLLLARIDLTGRHLLYANAGHPPGYLLDRTGAVKAAMNATGLPLGMFQDSDYGMVESLAIERGDTLVLLTDGITESESGDGTPFGTERTLDVIREHLDEPAGQITHHVYRSVREFARETTQRDDITIVVCKFGNL